MGMTLLQLLNKQPPYVINHAGGVVVKNVQERVAPKTNLPAVTATALDTESNSLETDHNCQIVAIESPGKRTPTVKAGWVKVSCGCDWFKYYCLPGDMHVLTDKGYFAIRDIAGPRSPNLSLNYIVDGEVHAGTRPFITGVKDLVAVELANGRRLRATEDHLILTISQEAFAAQRYSETAWIKAGLLNSSHMVVCDSAIPKAIDTPIFGKQFYEGLVRGLYAHGNAGKSAYHTINIPQSEVEHLLTTPGVKLISGERFAESQRIKFKLSAYVERDTFITDHNSWFYGYLSSMLSRGNLVEKTRFDFVSSTSLLDSIQYILFSLGHNLWSTHKWGHRTQLQLDGGTIHQLLPRVRLIESVDRCLRSMPKVDQPPINAHAVTSVAYRQGFEEVYDLSVPSVSKFIAEGIVVHNCEYALSKHGAANIRHSNGMPASVTNPTNYPLLCIAANQLVDTARGPIPISVVTAGDTVLTPVGLRLVTATQQTGSDVPVMKLTTADGRELVCTHNHLVFKVPHAEGLTGWVRADSNIDQPHYLVTVEQDGTKPIVQDQGEKLPFSFNAFMYSVVKTALIDYEKAGNSLRDLSCKHSLSVCNPAESKYTIESVAQSLAELVFHSMGFVEYPDSDFTRERGLRFYRRLISVLTRTNLGLRCENFEWLFTHAKFDNVVEVNLEGGESDVYDITVDEAHCFFASGVLVHNCKHLYALGVKVLK